MDKLAAVSEVVIIQEKELGEALTGFERKNRYAVRDPAGSKLYTAVETGNSWIGRQFLKANRPFTVELSDPFDADVTSSVLRVERPFRWYFHEVSVTDASGRLLGSLRREFSLLQRIYSVTMPSGDKSYSLFGRLLRPWTFEIRKHGQPGGMIRKKWGGVFREAVTDADTFSLEFDPSMNVDEKAFFLGAVFLIDFVHFEH